MIRVWGLGSSSRPISKQTYAPNPGPTFVCMPAFMHVRVCIYIYIHTHTHPLLLFVMYLFIYTYKHMHLFKAGYIDIIRCRHGQTRHWQLSRKDRGTENFEEKLAIGSSKN